MDTAAHQIFFLARQKGVFLKYVIKQDGYKIIDVAIMMVAFHEPGSSQEVIRDITSFDEASVARSLKDLEGRKLIIRTVNSENRRLKQVTLTQKGLKIIQRFDRIMKFWDDQALSGLTNEDRDVLGKILEKILIDRERLSISNLLKEWRKIENE